MAASTRPLISTHEELVPLIGNKLFDLKSNFANNPFLCCSSSALGKVTSESSANEINAIYFHLASCLRSHSIRLSGGYMFPVLEAGQVHFSGFLGFAMTY